MSLGVKGVMIDGCELKDIDMATVVSQMLKFLIDDMHIDDIESFEAIANDIDEVLDGYLSGESYLNKISFQQSADIDAGIVHEAFSKYS